MAIKLRPITPLLAAAAAAPIATAPAGAGSATAVTATLNRRGDKAFHARYDRVQELYLSGRVEEAEAALPDELIEKTNLIGPRGHIRDRIAALYDAGVTHLHVQPVGENPAALLSQVKEWLP
jgi:hypothetical protein